MLLWYRSGLCFSREWSLHIKTVIKRGIQKKNSMKKSNRILAVISFSLFLFLVCANAGLAQSTTSEKKWNFRVDIYLMFPTLDGETGVGNNLTAPVDASTGDIFSKLKMAAMVYGEAYTEKWAITSDYVFMNLQQEVTPTTLIHSGTVTIKQSIWEAAGLYRLNSFMEVGIGGRLNTLVTDFEGRRNVFPGTEVTTGHHSVTFYDPVLIARLATVRNEKWLFQFRGDLGGFGVGSDFTWQLQGYAGYRFSKVFQLSAGYRFISIDYNKGSDMEQFTFDMNEYGPVIRLGFNF